MTAHYAYWTDALPRPYADKDKTRELSRLSADIPYSDKNLISSVCPKRGILNQITQVFFAALCANLRTHNIHHYEPEYESYFVQLINSADDHIRQHRRRTASELVDQALAPDDGAGTTGPHSGTPGSLVKQRNPKKTTVRRKSTEGTEGKQVRRRVKRSAE